MPKTILRAEADRLYGTGLRVGDIVEHPFRSAHPWRVSFVGPNIVGLEEVER